MMKCRDYLIEFEDRSGDLTEAATMHLKICGDCQKMSDAQTQVWLMIDNLRKIDAPKDFDFRVKAKIANAKPTDFQPRFLPVLRYVLPAALVVLIFGAVAFNSTYFFGNDAPPLAQTTSPNSPAPLTAETSPSIQPIQNSLVASENILPAAPINNPALETFPPKTAANERDTQFVAIRSTRKSPVVPRRENSQKDTGGGSVVKAATSTTVLVPENLNASKTVNNLPNANNVQNSIKDAEILEFIGIETVSDNGGRKVKSVKTDSLADRSGVKVGDVVESIDGRKVSEELQKDRKIEGKTLTVKRGAEKIEINLQNKSN